jgi:hypothetical protein
MYKITVYKKVAQIFSSIKMTGSPVAKVTNFAIGHV